MMHPWVTGYFWPVLYHYFRVRNSIAYLLSYLALAKSFSTDLLHASLAVLLICLPLGAHLIATLSMLFCSILWTWQIHHHLLWFQATWLSCCLMVWFFTGDFPWPKYLQYPRQVYRLEGIQFVTDGMHHYPGFSTIKQDFHGVTCKYPDLCYDF